MNHCEREGSARPGHGGGGLTVALAGNPNCGKTALFNALTGIRQKTGNWPGVTVERKEGRLELDGREIRVIDLPGIYSLDASSPDEQVTRDYLLSRDADLIVNVVDASNLERNLYLTVQLLEMGVPLTLVLNMMDVARNRGILLDPEHLSRELGCPVAPVVAVTQEGMTELEARILSVAGGRRPGGFDLAQEECVEQALAALAPCFEDKADRANGRWLALKLLEGDPVAEALAGAETLDQAGQWRQFIQDRSGEVADIHIADTRFGHAHALAAAADGQLRGSARRTVEPSTPSASAWENRPSTPAAASGASIASKSTNTVASELRSIFWWAKPTLRPVGWDELANPNNPEPTQDAVNEANRIASCSCADAVGFTHCILGRQTAGCLPRP